jgi:phenylalanyl-tRNA synthetase beta subunit
VETVGFAKADGTLSDRKVVERFEKSGGTLIDHASVTEGGITTLVDLPSSWRPDLSFSENVCEEGYRRYGLENGSVINFNTLPGK